MDRKEGWIPAILFVAALGFHLLTLMRFPAPFVDEGWNASRGWALLYTGQAFSTLDIGVIEKFDGYWTFFPWLPVWIHSQILRLFNSPNLFAVRIVSLAFGGVLLVAIYAIANRLNGRRFALLSAFLVSLSWPFLYSAHLARTDIMAAALGFVAVALHINNGSSRPWVSLLSGVCVGLAYEMHAHGGIFGPAIVALYFLDLRWRMFRRLVFWGFVSGVVVGLAFYAALHVLPYPQTYYKINQLTFAVHHVPPILTLNPRVIGQAIADMCAMLYAAYQPMIPVILWAVVVLIKRHSQVDRKLLVLAASLAIGHALLIRNKFMYYAVLVTPALDLIVAAFLIRFSHYEWRGRLRDYIYHVFVWGLLTGSIALNLSVLRKDYQADYQLAQSRINQVVQPGDSIMGPQTYWFGLHDHVYFSWEKLSLYQRFAQGSTLAEAVRAFQPDIFIIDRFVDAFIVDHPTQADNLYVRHLGLPRAELSAFLDRQAELVASFDGGYYRQVRVYRISWVKDLRNSQ